MNGSLVTAGLFEVAAQDTIAEPIWDFFSDGAMMQVTVKDNEKAFQNYRFRPRVMKDVSKRNTSTKVLNRYVDCPIGISPVPLQRLLTDKGEIATAKAASRLETILIVSLFSSIALEDVSAKYAGKENGKGMIWFELRFMKSEAVTRKLVWRAEQAGYKGLVVSASPSILTKRIKQAIEPFEFPKKINFANLMDYEGYQYDRDLPLGDFVESHVSNSMSWADLRWLHSITNLPIIVRGILTGEDAILAVDNGASGIIVSNFEGRYLDGQIAAIDALEDVVASVGRKTEVYFEGGITKGEDVLKALALGAKFVFIDRPITWGLILNGTNGVRAVHNILCKELDVAMAQTGLKKIDDAAPEMIRKQVRYVDDIRHPPGSLL